MRLRNLPYNKVCGGCGKQLRKGEEAWFGKHEGARCLDCGQAASGPAPSPTPAPAPDAGPHRPPRPRPPAPAPDAVYGSPAAPDATCPPAELGADGVHRFAWDSVSELVADALSDRAQSEDARRFIRDGVHREHAGDKWANRHTVATLRKAVSNPSG